MCFTVIATISKTNCTDVNTTKSETKQFCIKNYQKQNVVDNRGSTILNRKKV